MVVSPVECDGQGVTALENGGEGTRDGARGRPVERDCPLPARREEDEEIGEEEAIVRRRADPRAPTREERERHELTHVPFRSWCRFCVMGRGKEQGHPRREGARTIPTVHMDYAFMGEGEDRIMPVITAKEEETKMFLAAMVPRKGTTGTYAAKRVLAFLKEIGLETTDVVFKTGQEPAIRALVEDVSRRRENARTIHEESPRGSPPEQRSRRASRTSDKGSNP